LKSLLDRANTSVIEEYITNVDYFDECVLKRFNELYSIKYASSVTGVSDTIRTESDSESFAPNKQTGEYGFQDSLSFKNISEKEESTQSILSIFNNAMNLSVAIEDEESANSLAERLILSYFDRSSILTGENVSRQLAGNFQSLVLNDVFRVSSINFFQGAVIFEGSIIYRSKSNFTDEIDRKIGGNTLFSNLNYFLVKNEKYPSLDSDITKMVMDSIVNGVAPAIILYPATWNSTISISENSGLRNTFKPFILLASYITTFSFALSCYDGSTSQIFNDETSSVFNLALLPLSLQLISSVFESFVAKLKDVKISTFLLPSALIGQFGARSTYLSPPKTRNDLFDIAFYGNLFPLIISIGMIYTGIHLSATDTTSTSLYPKVNLSLLNINSFISQIISSQFPGIFENLNKDPNILINVHWLLLSGIVCFLSAVLQLFPIDNTSGSKMALAVFGIDNFSLLSFFVGLIKFIFLLPYFFDPSALSSVDKSRLWVDYFLTSQLLSNNMVIHSFFLYNSYKYNYDNFFVYIFRGFNKLGTI
jgi:hypothetical protein